MATRSLREEANIQWQVNEGLLQQYRSLGMTVQSFLLTVGTIVATMSPDNLTSTLALGVITLLSLLHLTAIWSRVVWARALISDYHKHRYISGLSEEQLAELEAFCPQQRFIDDKARRADVWRRYFGHASGEPRQPTRRKLDVWVPMIYLAVWVCLVAIKISAHMP